jgi:hypothetical protein
VVGVTLALFVLGAVAGGLAGHQSRPTQPAGSLPTARGAILTAVPARTLLAPIVTPGQPPDDLLDALAVPRGSVPVAGSSTNRGVELYDRSLRFQVPASQHDVIAFFRAQLPFQHWQVLSQQPTSGFGYLVLDQHPASDGHEWEVGVTIAPTTFGAATPGSAGATGTTAFTVRLFARSDQA